MQFDWQQLFDEVKVLGQFGSDAQLAEHLGLSRAQISAWRTGKSELGTLVRLKLLDALGHDSLHSVMESLWPVRKREELIRQHESLLERVSRGVSFTDDAGLNNHEDRRPSLHANQLLAALPPAEQERIRPHLSPVSMELGRVVYESGDALRDVYLPTTAVTDGCIKYGAVYQAA